jgi:hypothetical protein
VKPLKKFFDESKIFHDKINVNTIQKLQYQHGPNSIWEFLTCPTVGDGNCFFHASFTEHGETTQVVQGKSVTLWKGFCDAVQQVQFLEDLRYLVYEHYLGLLAYDENHASVPPAIRQQLQEKINIL